MVRNLRCLLRFSSFIQSSFPRASLPFYAPDTTGHHSSSHHVYGSYLGQPYLSVTHYYVIITSKPILSNTKDEKAKKKRKSYHHKSKLNDSLGNELLAVAGHDRFDDSAVQPREPDIQPGSTSIVQGQSKRGPLI
jgi:hypothetical protein